MEEKKPDTKTDAEKKKDLNAIMEEYRKAHNLPMDISDSITHEDFVIGVRTTKIGFKVLKGEPIGLVKGTRKIILNILVLLYMWIPFIIIPLLAYFAANWWLLFAVVLSPLFAHFAAWKNAKAPEKWKANIIIYFTLFCIGYWIKNGFHFFDYITFFFFCSLWGHLLFLMAESVQNFYAMQELIENAELFYSAIKQEKIMIIKVREQQSK